MRPIQVLQTIREMGPAWAASRAAYEIQRRGGWLRRSIPVGEWSQYTLGGLTGGRSSADVRAQIQASPLRVPGVACFDGSDSTGETAVEEVDQVLRGRFRFFSAEVREVGFPPAWHRHPDTGDEWPRVHWTAIDDADQSDVKWSWELGRFGIAYAIVRACVATRDRRYSDAFWQLVESWRDANPPNVGVHWMCGQECAFRSLAWTFALLQLADAEATTDARVGMLVEMLAAHAERIEANLAYARSQKNNHAINEALALWVVGTALPMLRSAEHWERLGRTVLEEECQRQIYTDGAYVQQSLGYHRLILQSCGWAIAWGTRSGRPFSRAFIERYGQAARLLDQLVDETSGRMPNYGSNDGSTLFNLDVCDPADARPALALAFRVAGLGRPLPPGPWDESVRWLTGQVDESRSSPPARTDLAANEGGYYTLHGAETWGFLRCCRYRDRPAQADMLHLDLWWRGHNIVADPGTYSYTGPAPWHNGLSSTRVHNAPSIDGLDQMERGSRFVWLHWNEGRVLRRSIDQPGMKLLAAEQNGYAKRSGVGHRRTVALVDGVVWVIVDDLEGAGSHHVSAQWLFPGASVEAQEAATFRIAHPAGRIAVAFADFSSAGSDRPRVSVVEPTENSPYGWFSPTYQHKQTALALHYSRQTASPMRVVTAIALGESVDIGAITHDGLSVVIDGVPSTFGWDSGHRIAT